MKRNDLKEVSTLELFLELEKRRDVRYFNAGKHRPYSIQAKYGALPLEEDDEPMYALAVREKVFREWSLEQHMFDKQSECCRSNTADNGNEKASAKIQFALFCLACFIGSFVGSMLFKLVIKPLLFS